MPVLTLAILAGSPPAAIELASVPWIGAQPHPQSVWTACGPDVSTGANRGPSSYAERVERSAPTSANQNPRRNPHSARGTPAAHFPRFRALALFGRPPPRRVVRPSSRRPKTCTYPEIPWRADGIPRLTPVRRPLSYHSGAGVGS